MSLGSPAALTDSNAPVDQTRLEEALRTAYEGVDSQPGAWERISAAAAGLFDWLAGFIADRLNLPGWQGAVGWLALIAVSITLVWAAVWISRRIGLVREAPVRRPPDSTQFEDWPAVAALAMSRGNLAEATRAYFRQLIATLSAKGWLTDQPGLTAGDCRRAAQRMPDAYAAVESATAAFERVAYGNRPADPEDVASLRKALDLVEAAPSRPLPARTGPA